MHISSSPTELSDHSKKEMRTSLVNQNVEIQIILLLSLFSSLKGGKKFSQFFSFAIHILNLK